MPAITDRQRALMAEIRADVEAYKMLKSKCRWEGMGQYAVLSEWGDPRKWPGYTKDVLLRAGR
jgi:hypothetical protein